MAEHVVLNAVAHAPPRPVRPAVPDDDRLDPLLLGDRDQALGGSPDSDQLRTVTDGNRRSISAR